MQGRTPYFAHAACGLTIAAATVVLAGWQLDVGALKSVFPHLVTMKPITAVAFLACGISLWLHLFLSAQANSNLRSARAAARGLALLAVSFGVLTFVEILGSLNLKLEEVLFHRALLASGIVNPGRMSTASALGFVVLGCALLAFEMDEKPRTRLWQPLSLAVVLFALVQFLGYVYGAGDLYRTFAQNPMAVHTAFLFLVMGLGMFAARSDRGWIEVFTSVLPGGIVARRILPGAILLPILLGWLRLGGQRLGLYQTEFGLALFASMNIGTFVAVVWFAARSLNASASTLQAANEELAISEERLRMATEGGGVGVWNWNLQTGELHNSEVCREICGFPADRDINIDEALGRVHPDDRAGVDDLLGQAVIGDGKLELECRLVWTDGSVHWVASRGKVYADSSGRAVRMEGIVQDIAARKFAEKQTKLLAAIVESSDDAIYTKDLNGLVTSWNPGAERIFGYKAAEVMGHPVGLLAVAGKEGELDEILDRVGRGETIHHFQTQRQAKDGRVLDVSLTLSPLRDSQGAIVGVSSIARDITDQHAVERQLRQAQKMEAVGQLAGGVAHDFNNLIMVMNSYAQLILEDKKATTGVREQAEHILDAGEKAAAVTRQLLAFSRKQVQDLKIVNLSEFVPSFCSLLPRILGEEIEVVVENKAEALCIRADQGQIGQVLMNLVVNARDAMPKGGKLTIALESAEVDADYCLEHALEGAGGEYAVIAVRDTGLGMTAETKAHIFEPFFTTKEVGKGTGLGLATVYGIVKQHGGMVWVYSEPGLGTEFKICLPRCYEGCESEAPPEAKPEVEGGSETILLVEDEGSLREAVKAYLNGKGYHVLDAENGAAALRVCESHQGPIDLLLTDFVMPGMRGAEVAAEVRKRHPGAAVIFMSGYADHDLEIGDGRSRHHFLQKPMSLRVLADQIRRALVQARERGDEQ